MRVSGDDLYPSGANARADAASTPPLDLPGGAQTGVTVAVHGDPGDPSMAIDVDIA